MFLCRSLLRGTPLAARYSTSSSSSLFEPKVFLTHSCGLSIKDAEAALNRISLKAPDRANAVLHLLEGHGFTFLQRSNMIKMQPVLLCVDANKFILPKFTFFESVGLSSSTLHKAVEVCPTILLSSLEKRLIPNYDRLKELLVSPEDEIDICIRRSPMILVANLKKHFEANVNFLESSGVPPSSISRFLVRSASLALGDAYHFRDQLKVVEGFGSDPSKKKFVKAFSAFYSLKASTWQNKIQAYHGWGWSETQTLAAFCRKPTIMDLSSDLINDKMRFLVDKIGWSSEFIAKHPAVLTSNLERTIAPRCSVLKAMQEKGLLQKDFNLQSVCIYKEDDFVTKFLLKYKMDFPELLGVYRREKQIGDIISRAKSALRAAGEVVAKENDECMESSRDGACFRRGKGV